MDFERSSMKRSQPKDPERRSAALLAARKVLGPYAHVRRLGNFCQVGIWPDHTPFQIMGSGFTYAAALRRATE